jgi:exodeoxyribonuclease V beta subunit
LLDKVRSDYQVAIIDEFQDTSPQQCAIFRSLFESEDVGRDSAHPYPHLYVVGDPKQSIYRFRGADIYAYMGVSRNDKVRKLQLATNYRSEPAVVGGINELFQGTSAYLLLEEDVSLDVRFNDNYQADGNWVMELERPIRLVFGNNEKKVQERDLISGVSSEIVSILNDPWQYRFSRGGNTPEISRNVVPGDIAVLVRTKKEGYKMLNALARRNVPAVFQGSIPVLESDEAAAMYHLMHCMLNPKNLRLIRAFLVSALYGGASVGESDWSDASLERIASLLVEAGERWEKKGFLSAITFLEQKMDLHKKMLSRNLGERRITNFLHLAELLNHQEWSAKLPPYALLTWFGKEMSHSALSEDENSLRMEREGKAVRIITAHQCKGLEYPIVFCPFHGGNLTKKLSYTKPPFVWHEETESFGLKVAMTKEEKDEEVLNELLDDEFRLLYVAITRAKNLCYLYVPSLEGTSPVTALMEKKSPSVDNADNEKEEEDTEELGEIGRLQKWADQTRYIDFQKITVNEETYNGLNEDILIKLVEPEKLRKSYWYETRGKSSFSMITRNVDHHRDDDDQEEKSVLNDDTDEGVETSPVHKAKVSGVMLKSFIGGTKTGSLVHDTLEEILKTGWDKADSVIRRRFPVKEYSVDDQSGDKNKQIRNREDMQSMVQLLKQISLPTGSGDTVCLGYLSPAQCLPEVEFDFPFTGTKQENQNIKKALATNERLRGYADNLSNLSARPGFMNGIIDLVFEQNGKFYILDWKTNTLGDYRRAALDQAMGHSHYYLQYHIYLLALHLYLKKRMAGYEYEKHFGGVYYLFVRGMSDGTDHGVFFDRPIEATVQAMDNIWRGGING